MSRPGAIRSVGADQIAYYRTRAPWYDDAYTCTGDYDRGPASERVVARRLGHDRKGARRLPVHGTCVELGAGTGYWTERVIGQVDQLWALDASPEAQGDRRGAPGCSGRARSSSTSWISGSGAGTGLGFGGRILLLGTRPRPDSAGVARSAARCSAAGRHVLAAEGAARDPEGESEPEPEIETRNI